MIGGVFGTSADTLFIGAKDGMCENNNALFEGVYRWGCSNRGGRLFHGTIVIGRRFPDVS